MTMLYSFYAAEGIVFAADSRTHTMRRRNRSLPNEKFCACRASAYQTA